MKKIVYIDVGTHFGQEFGSMFGGQRYFYWRLVRRFLGYYLLKRGEKIPIRYFFELIVQHRQFKNIESDFSFYFVEANSNIINYNDFYKKSTGVFNCALTNTEDIDIRQLFLDSNDLIGQGSSIFPHKNGVSSGRFSLTIGVPAKLFFFEFKRYIDKLFVDYQIILRLNCEGVEDDVVYAANTVFKENLVLIMGSLKDVRECKGDKAYEDLEDYISNNSLAFIPFSSFISTWLRAHSSVVLIHKKLFDNS